MNNKLHGAKYELELLELIENGQNVGDVAQEYRVPVNTIRRWMNEGRRDRKNTLQGKRRGAKYQEQHDYAAGHKGSAKG